MRWMLPGAGVCRKKARRGQATDALGPSSLCTHTVSRNDFGEEREGGERRGSGRGEEGRGEERSTDGVGTANK